VHVYVQVADTWERIEDDQEDFGIKLFMRLFKIAPKTLRLFSFRGLSFFFALILHAMLCTGTDSMRTYNLRTTCICTCMLEQKSAYAHACMRGRDFDQSEI
jgi:hypothetical protein